MKLFRIALVVFLLGLGLVYPTPNAFACSCEEPGPDAVAIRQTDAVFSGRVVDTAGPIFSDRRNGYALAVDTVYKGTLYEKQWVFSATQDTECGIELTWGRRYLVFAHGDDAEQLSTSSCSSTRVLDGEPNLEVAGTVIPGRSRSSPPDIFWAGFTIAAGVFAYRRGKNHHSA